MEDPVLIPVWSDTHPNNKIGLIPPAVEIEVPDGEPLSVIRRGAHARLYSQWLAFWEAVKVRAEELKAYVTGVQVGDGSEDNFRRKEVNISTNKSDILNIGEEVLQPAVEVCDEIYIVRGTPFHTGSWCWQEEAIAQRIGAVKDPVRNTYSWWQLELEAAGVKGLFRHKPPTFGFKKWTIDAAVGRASADVRFHYLEAGVKVPDFAVFAHFHTFRDSGPNTNPYVVFLPSWCLTSVWAIVTGRGFPKETGGGWFVCQDGKATFEKFTKTRKPRPPMKTGNSTKS